MIAINDPKLRRPHSWRLLVWSGLALLLAMPMVAMQVTREVNWDLWDFAAATMLLTSLGVAIEIAVRMIRPTAVRIVAIVAAVGSVALVWAEAAVGILS